MIDSRHQIARFTDRLSLPVPGYQVELVIDALEMLMLYIETTLEDAEGTGAQQATRVLRTARSRSNLEADVEAMIQSLKAPAVRKPGDPQ